MKLRERQETFVAKCADALRAHGNTLGVAPTGAGKTVMLSAIGRKAGDARTLIIQHRDELVDQNMRTFKAINPHTPTSLFNADEKVWAGEATFAMIQTLARQNNLDSMPAFERVIIDEAHHAAADSYLRVIEHARDRNSAVELFGVTATPVRGDRKALKGVFTNVGDQISLYELIKSGHLVPPKAFVIDVGTQSDLKKVRKTASDYDMGEVAKIMDQTPINDKIVEEWEARASERQTVVFCSTLEHAEHVLHAFQGAGHNAAMVWGDMPGALREKTLAAYDRGEIQILVNVFVLTEGWDHQPTACIILLRPSSYKSTITQMIGRGLRKVDPERYPGVQKDDCVVLDFGTSLLLHGDINVGEDLEGMGTKDCPECNAELPQQVRECAICGYEFPHEEIEELEAEDPGEKKERQMLSRFEMTEIDLFNDSPFKWEELFGGIALCATAFDAWAICLWYGGRWVALGGRTDGGSKTVSVVADSATRSLAIVAADDFLRINGDRDMAGKSKTWLKSTPTDGQLRYLGLERMQTIGMTRYQAACSLTWKFNESKIRAKVESIGSARMAA